MKKEWKILTWMVCFISALNKKNKKENKKNTLLIKKNKEKQHTFGWEEKKMLELGWEGEKEEKIKKKRNRCVREKDEALICHDSGILF